MRKSLPRSLCNSSMAISADQSSIALSNLEASGTARTCALACVDARTPCPHGASRVAFREMSDWTSSTGRAWYLASVARLHSGSCGSVDHDRILQLRAAQLGAPRLRGETTRLDAQVTQLVVLCDRALERFCALLAGSMHPEWRVRRSTFQEIVLQSRRAAGVAVCGESGTCFLAVREQRALAGAQMRQRASLRSLRWAIDV
eukprot:1044023-Prymnesium_polylepis.5